MRACPKTPIVLVLSALAGEGRDWGRFDVELTGRAFMLRVVAFMMNWRSRLTGVATGDQAIFMRRDAFLRAGRYPDIPLMEDIAISKALKRLGPPVALTERVIASGRRFEAKGVWRLILLMWCLRLAYWAGADTGKLARRYGYVPRPRLSAKGSVGARAWESPFSPARPSRGRRRRGSSRAWERKARRRSTQPWCARC